VKTIILAGGLGTRLQEETTVRPKPMVEIGGKPILWHIMNIYAAHAFDEFVVALGYKGEVIKQYFLNFFALNNDITVDLRTGGTTIYDGQQPTWKVHLAGTGDLTQTGGRLRRLKHWVGDETFMMTYGDGLADVDVAELVAFHRSHGKLATVTTVRPTARFGGVVFSGDRVVEFTEKPQAEGGWINGGFFVLEPDVLDYIEGDQTIWERDPMERLAADGQLMAYRHEGFWQPMDTLREKKMLEDMWAGGDAPWSAAPRRSVPCPEVVGR
jgi:glucose-1-phosphate cytidylyltransferase